MPEEIEYTIFNINVFTGPNLYTTQGQNINFAAEKRAKAENEASRK